MFRVRGDLAIHEPENAAPESEDRQLAGRHWHRGIGSAAVAAMLTEPQSPCAVRTSVAVPKANNLGSAARLKKSGFIGEPPAGLEPIAAESDKAVVYLPAHTPPNAVPGSGFRRCQA
jgi:hypothetical protein